MTLSLDSTLERLNTMTGKDSALSETKDTQSTEDLP